MATKKRSSSFRFIKLLFRLIIYFILITLIWVGLYAFIPPPVTATMLLDDNGITKDWVPLSEISPNLTRAVIAAEDGKFCSHNGFDVDAIAKAIEYRSEERRVGKAARARQAV